MNRRTFLKSSTITSLSVLPGLNELAKLFTLEEPRKVLRLVHHAFRLTKYQTLLNLDFYFVSNIANAVHLVDNKLNIRYGQDEVYMIVRLPQQHITEEYYLPKPDSNCNDTFDNLPIAASHISGYSYLVFQFIFVPNEDEYDWPINEENFLNWNSPRLRLVVRQKLDASIFETVPEKQSFPSLYPLGYKIVDKKYQFDYDSFPSANRTQNDPAPITAIDVPWRLILSPKLPDQDKYDFCWEFSQPIQNIKPSQTIIHNELWLATLRLKQREYECPPSDFGVDDSKDKELELMMIGTFLNATSPGDQDSFQDKHFLPTPKDRADLVDLYILWKLTAKASKLTFSPLGITTKINFHNPRVSQTASSEKRISLIDWKQFISLGRDEEILVTNLVMEAETGMKMIHVRTAKRQTYKGNAILQYREYIEPLELEKDYSEAIVSLNDNKEVLIDAKSFYNRNTYKANIPYKKIILEEAKKKRIKPVKRAPDYPQSKYVIFQKDPVSDNDPIIAFWPLDYCNNEELTFKYTLIDWEGNKITINKKVFIIRLDVTYQEFSKNIDNQPLDPTDDVNRNKLRLSNSIVLKQTNLQLTNPKKLNASKDDIQVLSSQAIVDSINKVFDNLNNYENEFTTIWGQIEKTYGNHYRDRSAYLKKIFSFFTQKIDERIQNEEAALLKLLDKNYYEFTRLYEILKKQLIEIHGSLQKIINIVISSSQIYYTKISNVEQKITDLINSIRFIEPSKNISIWVDRVLNRLLSLKGELEFLKSRLPIQEKIQQVIDFIDLVNKEIIEFDKEIYKNFSILVDSLMKVNQQIAELIREGIWTLHQLSCEFNMAEAQISNKIDIARQKITFVVNRIEEAARNAVGWNEEKVELEKLLNKTISRFETTTITLSVSFRKLQTEGEKAVLDFFHEHACYPQLHEAEVIAKSVTDLVRKEVPFSIQYAEKYLTTQINDTYFNIRENASAVFAEVVGDAQQKLKGIMREMGQDLGGMVNPELPVEYLTFLRRKKSDVAQSLKNQKEQLKNQLKLRGAEFHAEINDSIKLIQDKVDDLENQVNNEIEQDLLFISEEVHQKIDSVRQWGQEQIVQATDFFKGLEAKILGQIPLKDILGIGFEIPQLIRNRDTLSYQFITDKFQPVNIGLLQFKNQTNKVNSHTNLIISLEKSLTNATQYKSITKLTDFQVGILDRRLVLNFNKLEIRSSNEEKRKVDVKLGDIEFNKELAFLKNISDFISNLIGIPGLVVDLQPTQINVGYSFAVPSISGGAFSLAKLNFFVGAQFPIPIGNNEGPMRLTLGINRPDNLFVVAAGIFGGRGFFNLTTTTKHLEVVDAAIEFGGYLGIDLVIAKGEVFLMAGIRFTYTFSERLLTFSGYLICGGSVTAFGFITVSVTFLLQLTYQRFQGRSTLYGTASVTYSIKIGFFKKSFSLSFSKRIFGAQDKMDQETAGIFHKKEPVFYAYNGPGLPPSDLEVDVEPISSPSNNKITVNDLELIFEQDSEWETYVGSYCL